MTQEQKQMLAALRNCTFLPGSYDKRFVNDMSNKAEDYELSDKQAVFLEKLHHRYRRQIGNRAERP